MDCEKTRRGACGLCNACPGFCALDMSGVQYDQGSTLAMCCACCGCFFSEHELIELRPADDKKSRGRVALYGTVGASWGAETRRQPAEESRTDAAVAVRPDCGLSARVTVRSYDHEYSQLDRASP
eukprot:3821129-Prymnesium_polylepis.1